MQLPKPTAIPNPAAFPLLFHGLCAQVADLPVMDCCSLIPPAGTGQMCDGSILSLSFVSGYLPEQVLPRLLAAMVLGSSRTSTSSWNGSGGSGGASGSGNGSAGCNRGSARKPLFQGLSLYMGEGVPGSRVRPQAHPGALEGCGICWRVSPSWTCGPATWLRGLCN